MNKTKYNIEKAIDNINKIIEEKGIEQKEIEAITGVAQSNISNILNKKKNKSGSLKFFSVEQLVALSSTWNISVDELLGLDHKISLTDIQYKDVFKKLCEIDEYALFCTDTITRNGKDIPCLYFKYDVLNKMLKEWSAIQTLREGNDYNSYNNIKNVWKQNTLSSQDFRPFYWQYRTRDEQGYRLMFDLIRFVQENSDLTVEECANWSLRKNTELVDDFEIDNQITANCRTLLQETIDEYIESLSADEQNILRTYLEIVEMPF